MINIINAMLINKVISDKAVFDWDLKLGEIGRRNFNFKISKFNCNFEFWINNFEYQTLVNTSKRLDDILYKTVQNRLT